MDFVLEWYPAAKFENSVTDGSVKNMCLLCETFMNFQKNPYLSCDSQKEYLI